MMQHLVVHVALHHLAVVKALLIRQGKRRVGGTLQRRNIISPRRSLPVALPSDLVNEDSGYETILFVLPKCQRKHVADVDAKILIGFV